MPKVGTMLCAVPFRAARIRKIIISNGADRARLKMSSPGRLVGQTFSSIIPGPAAERRSLGFVFHHLPTDRPTETSSPQRLSKLVRDAYLSRGENFIRGQFHAPSIFFSLSPSLLLSSSFPSSFSSFLVSNEITRYIPRIAFLSTYSWDIGNEYYSTC